MATWGNTWQWATFGGETATPVTVIGGGSARFGLFMWVRGHALSFVHLLAKGPSVVVFTFLAALYASHVTWWSGRRYYCERNHDGGLSSDATPTHLDDESAILAVRSCLRWGNTERKGRLCCLGGTRHQAYFWRPVHTSGRTHAAHCWRQNESLRGCCAAGFSCRESDRSVHDFLYSFIPMQWLACLSCSFAQRRRDFMGLPPRFATSRVAVSPFLRWQRAAHVFSLVCMALRVRLHLHEMWLVCISFKPAVKTALMSSFLRMPPSTFDLWSSTRTQHSGQIFLHKTSWQCVCEVGEKGKEKETKLRTTMSKWTFLAMIYSSKVTPINMTWSRNIPVHYLFHIYAELSTCSSRMGTRPWTSASGKEPLGVKRASVRVHMIPRWSVHITDGDTLIALLQQWHVACCKE